MREIKFRVVYYPFKTNNKKKVSRSFTLMDIRTDEEGDREEEGRSRSKAFFFSVSNPSNMDSCGYTYPVRKVPIYSTSKWKYSRDMVMGYSRLFNMVLFRYGWERKRKYHIDTGRS